MTSASLLFAVLLQITPQTSDPTLPPPNTPVVLTALGRGVQIYTCAAAGPSAPHWTLIAPQAILLDPTTQQQIGTHSAGPTWTATDGSSIHGIVLAKLPSPDPTSIPWLLLAAQPPAGQTHGLLSAVTSIRRSATSGGAPPETGCDPTHIGATARAPYRATYTFFGKAPQAQ